MWRSYFDIIIDINHVEILITEILHMEVTGSKIIDADIIRDH